jgi:hypothetical protein
VIVPKVSPVLRGIDNESVAESAKSATPQVLAKRRRAPSASRAPSSDHPLLRAVRDAEAALDRAREVEDRAIARDQAADESHGDQLWDNHQRAIRAIEARETAEGALREARAAYRRELGELPPEEA